MIGNTSNRQLTDAQHSVSNTLIIIMTNTLCVLHLYDMRHVRARVTDRHEIEQKISVVFVRAGGCW